MSKGRILIVEDEFIISNDLSESLQSFGYDVVGIAESADEARTLLDNNKIDLVLLDINLNQPVDGVEIGHIINTTYKIPFIFVTAFTDKNTIERVKHTNPRGYISKPYEEVDLVMAIDLALRDNAGKSAVLSQEQKPEEVFIKSDEGLKKVTLSEILWLEAYDYYAYIMLEDSRILATTTLKNLEIKLDHPQFVKVHRKYTINVHHIDKLVGNQVEINGQYIPVSRTYKQNLLDQLNTV